MLEILTTLVPMFLLLVLGFLAGFSASFRRAEPGLNAFVFYVSLPAFVYASVASASVPEQMPFGVFGVAIGVTAGVSVLTYYGARLMGRAAGGAAGQTSLAGTFGNVGYFGIPITISALGTDAAVAAAVVHLIHNIMYLVGYPLVRSTVTARGTDAANSAHSTARDSTAGDLMRRLWPIVRQAVLLNPVALAMLVALGALNTSLEFPGIVDESIEMAADTAVPVALFAVGLAMHPAIQGIRSGGVLIRSIVFGTTVKVLALPAVTWLAVMLLDDHLGPVWAATLVLMAAMPSATTVFILSDQYDQDGRLAAAIMVVGTFCSMATIPLVAALLP